MLEPRLVINQCYILQEKLGEDSFCELWRATSIYSAVQFLLRFFKAGPGIEEGMEEFRSLAMATYSIAAPAVLDFVEVERFGDRGFIASEYSGERSLLAYQSSSPRIRLEHACRFVIELGQGLDAFHSRGIVYRCLNAENVLVSGSGDHIEAIRIQKPGYAPFLHLVDKADRRAVLENQGYMAPEAKAGVAVDRRSDIYSLGLHFYRFIVGKLPYADPERARTGSASLRHVARALARRGVPSTVARSLLKALRKDPGQRHNEVLELIAELRAFMDERRRELLAKGEVDPLAELATLNLGKDRVDATQAVRSLDTADYFRAISQAVMAPVPKGPVLLFPVDDFASPAEVERLEIVEANGEEDDGRLSVDDYIDEAWKTVRGESASKRPGVELEESKPRELPAKAKDEGLRPEAEASPFGTAPEVADIHPQLPRGLLPTTPQATGTAVGAFASDPGPFRKRKGGAAAGENVDAAGISWRQDAASPQLVVSGMESAFSRAFKGSGAFRFIQEPPPGPDAVVFARIFARFRARGLVVDLGTLPSGADATDLLRSLRMALAESLGYEHPQARRGLAKRLAAVDVAGMFRAAPLGAVLYGEDGHEPDPDWVESMEGSMSAARCIAALARRRKPLVLTLRGGEALGRTSHAILMELARLAPIASLCCFAFSKKGPVPSWHVLSRLSG
jgi:hypothetical protein